MFRCNCIIFRESYNSILLTLQKSLSLSIKLPEDAALASKHVAVLTIYKISFIYYICCAFIGLDNKLYKMHGTCIKILRIIIYQTGRYHPLQNLKIDEALDEV